MNRIERKRVLTTGEVAKYCGVHFRTVLRWIKRGQLRAFQLPGRGDNRVEVEDFLTFLRAHNLPIPDEFFDRSRQALIVEDDAAMARTIERALKKLGFETHIASDGLQAGALLRDLTPALVTLDLKMAGLGGMNVLEFIRNDEHLRNTKVLVISGMPRKELEKALSTGADDFLAKPFQPNELNEKVESLFQGSLLRLDRVVRE